MNKDGYVDPDRILDDMGDADGGAGREDNRPTEVPVISIERDDRPSGNEPVGDDGRGKRRRRWRWLWPALAVVVAIAGAVAWHYRYYLLQPDVPVSVSDSENLAKLEKREESRERGTSVVSEHVLGVDLDMYSLEGLRLSLERETPDTADQTLVMFMRSADYRPDSTVMGTVVVDGEVTRDKARKSRPGYMAISPEGKGVIGVSLTDRMPDEMARRGGSYFRQYVLLSAGELPAQFALHGKVERAAIGRMADDRLYYVVSRGRETMYGFADAMREYGFVDAIYLTGGNAYTFWRDAEGHSHSNELADEKVAKQPVAPLLVVRRE